MSTAFQQIKKGQKNSTFFPLVVTAVQERLVILQQKKNLSISFPKKIHTRF